MLAAGRYGVDQASGVEYATETRSSIKPQALLSDKEAAATLCREARFGWTPKGSRANNETWRAGSTMSHWVLNHHFTDKGHFPWTIVASQRPPDSGW